MIAALLAALLMQEDVDVLSLKDGTTRSGRVVSETPTHVVFESLILGGKGQIVGSARVTVERALIDQIRFGTAAGRLKAAERSAAFGARAARRAESLGRMKVDPVLIDAFRGFRIEGAHTVLESTCEIAFTKDVALCLEEVFAAYRKFFEVRRNPGAKVKVHLFDDPDQYAAFQVRRHGAAVMNPAYYHSEQNYIAAYNRVRKAEERRVRAEITTLERQIDTYRADLASAEKRVAFLAGEFRRKIQDAAENERRAIRADGEGGKDARISATDRKERELLDGLKSDASDLQKELAAERKKAVEAIEANRKVIERNEKILATQNREMFEMLFHEGFHAFAMNQLWEAAGPREIPRWLNEGMAAYFETSVVEGGELVHGAPHPAFLEICRADHASSGLLPLEKILTGGPERFLVTHRSQVARSGLYYAQSWALAHWLASRTTREGIAAYVGDILGGRDPVQAFEKLAGKSCRDVEADLKKHLDSLKTP